MVWEPYDFLIELFARTPPVVQGIVLAALLFAVVWLAVRKKTIKLELRAVALERDEMNLELERTKAQLDESRNTVEKLTQDGNDLRQTVGSLEEKLKAADQELAENRQQLEQIATAHGSLERLFQGVEQVDAEAWCRPCAPEFVPPPVVPKGVRKTILVSVQNLKGGVGKTTLVANLGAAYATGILGAPKRVLLVDLDFQGSLSNCCVSEEDLRYRRENSLTSSCLLAGNGTQPKSLLKQLMASVCETEGRAQIIVANEGLENADFRAQARFAINSQEVRFEHRRIFQDESVIGDFDLVLFDCPPRLTSSSINALFASDYIIIPTTLSPPDVQAVPRTLQWLSKLQKACPCPPTFLGVIVNRVYHRDGTTETLTLDEQSQFERLQAGVQKYVTTGNGILVKAVSKSPEVARFAAGSVPLGAKKKGHEIYRAVAEELYERLNG